MSYIIGSGWWCADTEKDDRAEMLGSNQIRERGFHSLWYNSIVQNSTPEKILIVDSNSPIKPVKEDDERLEFISLNVNAGHSTNHKGKFSGYSRAILVSLEYALQCDCDYFVYVEQDALLQGKGIIEHCISNMNGRPYMFGAGDGTGGILQQSFFIIKTSAISEFVRRLKAIQYTDFQMSPEDKFHVAACKFGGHITAALRKNAKQNKVYDFLDWQVRKYLRQWNALPIDYGRKRPIDFSQKYLYFQHGSIEELQLYLDKNTLASEK